MVSPTQNPIVKRVNWYPLLYNWVKCNTDGVIRGAPGPPACRGIFRDFRAAALGCFAANIGISCALKAELVRAMFAQHTKMVGITFGLSGIPTSNSSFQVLECGSMEAMEQVENFFTFITKDEIWLLSYFQGRQ